VSATPLHPAATGVCILVALVVERGGAKAPIVLSATGEA